MSVPSAAAPRSESAPRSLSHMSMCPRSADTQSLSNLEESSPMASAKLVSGAVVCAGIVAVLGSPATASATPDPTVKIEAYKLVKKSQKFKITVTYSCKEGEATKVTAVVVQD